MTEEQDKDELRFRHYLERKNLASLMNDTKWRELIAAIQSIDGYPPRFRVKCVRDREPDADRWDLSFPFHVPRFREIEWLEFDPLVQTRSGAITSGPGEDFGQRIESRLAHANVPFQRVGNAIRVVGYARPAKA